jgi:hypothetical protein
MSADRNEPGFGDKVGFSLLGLMAGNAANLLVLLLIALLQHLDPFAEIRRQFSLGVGEALVSSFGVWLFSMAGWVVVGLPLVLLLRAKVVADFYLVTAALIGVVLGLLSMLLLLLALNRGRLDIMNFDFRNPEAVRLIVFLFSDAALIAGVAFTVYCSLVKAALRRPKKNGAPRGTPRSIPWFEI